MLFVKDYPTRNYWIRGFPQNLVASLMFACISFYFLERPFSRLRKARFAQTKFNRESKHT
jgi:peptidoglycan/LPS O-acetylase OafA/YrhL